MAMIYDKQGDGHGYFIRPFLVLGWFTSILFQPMKLHVGSLYVFNAQ